MSPDAINGTLETLGGLFVISNIFRLARDKMVRGVHWLCPTYFTIWSFWYLFYYPHLDQWFSFYGGAFLAVTNAVWLSMFFYYRKKEKERWPFQVTG